jgi:hypothetical protein
MPLFAKVFRLSDDLIQRFYDYIPFFDLFIVLFLLRGDLLLLNMVRPFLIVRETGPEHKGTKALLPYTLTLFHIALVAFPLNFI